MKSKFVARLVSTGRLLSLGGRICSVMILLVLISPAAHAATFFSGWYYTGVIGPGAGESALVAEGILYDNPIGSARHSPDPIFL
jgi:hypothetical protein